MLWSYSENILQMGCTLCKNMCEKVIKLPVFNSKGRLWPWDYESLSPILQSPVDVIFCKSSRSDWKLLEITVPNKSIKCKITNIGHGVKVTVNDGYEKLYISGAFLQDNYILDNIHYHWGYDDYYGSEHFVNGECFSGEVHIVTYRRVYCNLEEAVKKRDGIIVLGLFFKVGSKNPRLENLVKHFSKIKEEGTSTNVDDIEPLIWFLGDHGIKLETDEQYFTYPGSLTTPPYSQSVTFILVTKPLPVSGEQLQKFRSLLDKNKENLLSNRREIQPLMNRPVIIGKGIKWNYPSR